MSLIDLMNLTEFKDILSKNLSGGNKRKLSVAIALICNPPIILLDEPSTGMDPEARRYMWKIIHDIAIYRKKSTIIMTTHSMEEAETLCEKNSILVKGELLCLGTSDEMVRRIAENLDFPPIEKTIYITEVATEEEMKMTTKQQIKHSAKQMGSRSLAMAKSFALIGAMFSGSECVVESYRGKKDAYNGIAAGCIAGGALAVKG